MTVGLKADITHEKNPTQRVTPSMMAGVIFVRPRKPDVIAGARQQLKTHTCKLGHDTRHTKIRPYTK